MQFLQCERRDKRHFFHNKYVVFIEYLNLKKRCNMSDNMCVGEGAGLVLNAQELEFRSLHSVLIFKLRPQIKHRH